MYALQNKSNFIAKGTLFHKKGIFILDLDVQLLQKYWRGGGGECDLGVSPVVQFTPKVK